MGRIGRLREVADAVGKGRPVVEISGPARVYPTNGRFLLTTVGVGARGERNRLGSLLRAWQDNATAAALTYLGMSTEQARPAFHTGKVGGPSAGLFLALGIVDKLSEQDLTGGRTIAGTGAMDADGRVGRIGGLPMKLLAAKRDHATVFVLPRAECGEADRAGSGGLRLVPVETLSGAVDALNALRTGGHVASCRAAGRWRSTPAVGIRPAGPGSRRVWHEGNS
ncbi:S16 family serine protease [Embleya sp. NPDC056575]|uniref:S16 family serine protease n=1 Tax=unclassified Embleya TaxID=2699296 RepID=UPI0036AAAE11